MKLGVLVILRDNNIEEEFKKLNEFGFTSCQLSCWDVNLFTDEMAKRIIDASAEYGIEVSALWCGWSGPTAWNFTEGPATLGLVPAAYRFQRMQELMKGGDFAKKINVTDVITHAGFLPENPCTTEYTETVAALRTVVEYYKTIGRYFLFETGQETPVTLLRTIEALGGENVGINLDTANLILYGKANPNDALDVFGKYVRNLHAKDGLYPTNGNELGEEVPLGEGKVDFPKLIRQLKELGYDGAITIEREIFGEQQIKDIKAAKAFLESLI